jgi:hypothetical protein
MWFVDRWATEDALSRAGTFLNALASHITSPPSSRPSRSEILELANRVHASVELVDSLPHTEGEAVRGEWTDLLEMCDDQIREVDCMLATGCDGEDDNRNSSSVGAADEGFVAERSGKSRAQTEDVRAILRLTRLFVRRLASEPKDSDRKPPSVLEKARTLAETQDDLVAGLHEEADEEELEDAVDEILEMALSLAGLSSVDEKPAGKEAEWRSVWLGQVEKAIARVKSS